MSEQFLGIRLDELQIETVSWAPGAIAHMQQSRAAQNAWCPEPEWVVEAVLEPGRIVRVATPDVSIKVVGFSASARRLVKAWMKPADEWDGAWWLIGSAAAANESDTSRYKSHQS